jgi:hypothetical protein
LFCLCSFEQTFGSSLNANLHFHALVLDGVYEKEAAVFHLAPSPSTADVQLVVDRVRERVEALLRARGLLDDEGKAAQDESDEDGQHVLLAASVAGCDALGLRAGAMPRWMRDQQVRRPRLLTMAYSSPVVVYLRWRERIMRHNHLSHDILKVKAYQAGQLLSTRQAPNTKQ